MKLSRIFELAKPLVAKDRSEMEIRIAHPYSNKPYARERFICCAVTELQVADVILVEDEVRARSHIAKRLGDYETVDGWLTMHKKVGKDVSSLFRTDFPEYIRRVQGVRLRMIDDMIAECAAQGI
jgi:hypothetical protein